MKHPVVLLSLIVAVGIAVGVIGDRLLSAQQGPVKRTELLRTDLAGIEGKEGVVYHVEIAPGAAGGRHYHPGHELIYVLEGSVIIEPEGTAPVTLQPGQVIHLSPKQVHEAKNVSPSDPARWLTFLLADKGQPLAYPVK